LVNIKSVKDRYNEVTSYSGLWTFIKGSGRYIYNCYLYKKYGFHPWHIQPIEYAPYRLEIIKQIENLIRHEKNKDITLVDMGSGIGDLSRNVRFGKNVHISCYDPDKKVIHVAKQLTKSGNITFKVGSFDKLLNDYRKKEIHIFYAIGFLHLMKSKMIKKIFFRILSEINISYIIIDERNHDFRDILGKKYSRVKHKKFNDIAVSVFKKNKN